MTYRRLGVSISVVAAIVAAFSAAPVGAATSPSVQVIDDSQLQAITTTEGGVAGAPSLNTGDTVPHWFGQTTDPHNGVTYGYNMVGADPNNCTGSACDVTVQADVQPLNVTIQTPFAMTFNGSDVMAATLASPVFATNDYGSTTAATNGDALETRGPGGTLSQGDAGVALQLEDATMRAQFNKTGAASTYHVRLQPNVLPAVDITIPASHGHLAQSGRGVIFGLVDIKYWATVIQNLQAHADAHHLPVYTTNDILNTVGAGCCVIGFHGAGIVPGSSKAVNGSGHGNGNQQVQTYSWATYLSPGIYGRPNGGRDWAVQDIHPLSHEISEWADDPFVNNFVEPWLTPTAPQYGCTTVMETGDPVVGIGFAMGLNGYQQGPNPNGTQTADGFFHPEDEVYLPWFMRTSPNTTSEANQTTAGGRYTLMGDLNRFAGFHTVATGCA